MDWTTRRKQIRARVVSAHGRALLWASATAFGMAAVMALAFSPADSNLARARIDVERPGPPPRAEARREVAANQASVTMHPIGCPPQWTKPGVTCWQAR